jgi:cellulose synthase/poly-beta-1,6-N-acetylglucosamine synthase-like glycosyltransferase
MIFLYYAITFILILFLVLPFVMVFFALFSQERLKMRRPLQSYDFGNIITAYRNAEIAKPLVQSLLKQTHQNHLIYLIADNCDIENWDIYDERLMVLRPEEPLNLKVKSIIHGMEHYRRPHNFTVIYDADNLAHPDFLKVMNEYANSGYTSIQGQRTAKNLDTTFAAMDSLGEFYKNYIERYVPYLLGSSSVISGSGMAVETALYRGYLTSPEIETGKHLGKKMLQEDKILQNHLLYQKEKIVYAKDALIYDEKVTTGDAVETQRGRWLYSYFQNLPNTVGLLLRGFFLLNWNQLLFALTTIIPPMFILLGISLIWMCLSVLVSWKMALAMFVAIGVFGLNIFLSLYLSRVPKAIWKAIGSLPQFAARQFTALFKMRNPNKNFKHSEHTVQVSIEEILNAK